MEYLYDGSFEGLMTAFSLALKDKVIRPVFYYDESDRELFSELFRVTTDRSASDRLLRYLGHQIDPRVLINLYYGYLSDDPHLEDILFDYLDTVFRLKADFSFHYADRSARAVNQLSDRVRTEVHRYYGILRFARMKGGLYYGQIDPDCNVAGLLSGHLKNRFPDQNWLLHDTRRNFGVYYTGGRLKLIEVTLEDAPENHYSEEEWICRTLWQTYFKKIAISERKNPRLQRQHIPVRYWKYLVEMEV